MPLTYEDSNWEAELPPPYPFRRCPLLLSALLIRKHNHSITHEYGQTLAEFIDILCEPFIIDVHLAQCLEGIKGVVAEIGV